ncbi:hypothetical protein J6590_031114 [Homalodisca vitripennis]|nr:hypothetical protein J6590_031114 [Homalodisca vitripennis]
MAKATLRLLENMLTKVVGLTNSLSNTIFTKTTVLTKAVEVVTLTVTKKPKLCPGRPHGRDKVCAVCGDWPNRINSEPTNQPVPTRSCGCGQQEQVKCSEAFVGLILGKKTRKEVDYTYRSGHSSAMRSVGTGWNIPALEFYQQYEKHQLSHQRGILTMKYVVKVSGKHVPCSFL